ncbi:YlxR family protein [Phytoactinopolyspora limicola]|uniref:YlxR family protein n=1 Tax=Phytoactinopolyspora limicola TaxID=2715536 RepID=UPI00140BF9F3|nr:YlxR family protein [Phytoactinopolyspora limicola]
MVSEDRAAARAPIRTCVGCRDRAEKQELLRVVVDGSGPTPGLVPDPEGRLPGRGAYIHPRPGCLDTATRRRAFARAFRQRGPLDASVVRRWLEAAARA